MKDLKLSLIIEAFDRATAPLRHINEAMEKVAERAEKIHHAFHKLGAAEFIGGALFTGALVETGHVAVEAADKIAEVGEAALKTRAAIGLSVEEIQRWNSAASKFGVNAEVLPRAFGMMEQHASLALTGNKESGLAFKTLGISPKEILGLSNNPEAMINRIVEGFTKIKNASTRMRVGRDMFGRGWLEIAPLLSAPMEEIDKFKKAFDKSGKMLTTEQAEQSKAYLQSMGRMRDAVQGLQTQLMVGLLPALTKVANITADWIKSIKPETIQQLAAALVKFADSLPALLPKLEKLAENAANVAAAFATWSSKAENLNAVMVALVGFIGAQAVVAIGELGFKAVAGAKATFELAKAFGALELVSKLDALWSLIAGLPRLIAVLRMCTVIMWGFDAAMLANPIGLTVLAVAALAGAAFLLIKYWKPISGFFIGLWNGLLDNGPKWLRMIGLGPLGDAIDYIHKHWSGITKWFGDLWDSVTGVFSTAWKKLSDLTPDWLKTLLKIGAIGASFTVNPALGAGVAAAMAPRGPPVAMTPGAITAHHQSAHVSGTIIVKAEPGTKVQSMKKTGDIDFAHHRGAVAP